MNWVNVKQNLWFLDWLEFINIVDTRNRMPVKHQATKKEPRKTETLKINISKVQI
jgi:hypothetical protein